MKFIKNPFVCAAFFSLAIVSSTYAASATWTGGSSGTWATAGNWTVSPVPTLADTATFNATVTNTTVATGTVQISNILFDTAAAASYNLTGGSITLNNAGAITVNSTVTNSQLISSAVVLGTTSTTSGYGFTNNSSTQGQFLTISGNVGSGASNTNNTTKTLTLGGSANGLISGVVSGNGSGNGTAKTAIVAVTKSGLGTWELSAANLYAGLTSVSAGTLSVTNTTGSATGIGAVSVGAGATLGGTGTIAPTGTNGINVSGVLAPGGSVGTGNLTFNLGGSSGTVAMNSGAGLVFELGLAGPDINSIGTSDLLTIAGAAAGDFAFTNNTINFLGTGGVGFYKIFDTDSNLANTWSGLTVSSGLITGGLNVSNLGAGLTGSLIMGGGLLGGTTGDIYLQVIPEPSAALLGGIGMLCLLRRRRSI